MSELIEAIKTAIKDKVPPGPVFSDQDATVDAIARAALAAVQASQWVPVSERLPEPMQFCDWLFPKSAYKHEYWILCNQALVTATTGGATHWRPAQPLPAAPQAEEVGK